MLAVSGIWDAWGTLQATGLVVGCVKNYILHAALDSLKYSVVSLHILVIIRCIWGSLPLSEMAAEVLTKCSGLL